MRILIAGYFNASWHEEAWSCVLSELGHEVKEFHISQYIDDNLWKRFQNRFMIGPLIRLINKEFINVATGVSPDVVLCFRALPIRGDSINRIKGKMKVICVCYQNDNIFGALASKAYWRHFRRSIPNYDLQLTTGQRGHRGIDDLSKYRESGANEVYLLHHSYLPWLHRPISRELLTGWKSDICFLGHCEPDRRLNELDTLMREVPGVYRIHGALWGKHRKGKAWGALDTHELYGEEYVKGLCGAKIALAFFSSWNADMYTQRVFEIPACGTFMLSQRTETMLELYEEDKEAVYYSNADELVEKARFYLKHDELRSRIAAAGRKRCISSGYDIYSKMQEWIAVVNKMREERFAQ